MIERDRQDARTNAKLHLLGVDHEQLAYRHAGRDYRLTDVSGEVVSGLVRERA